MYWVYCLKRSPKCPFFILEHAMKSHEPASNVALQVDTDKQKPFLGVVERMLSFKLDSIL